MAQPGNTVLIEESIGNIHCAIQHNFVTQAGACVYPGDTGSSSRAIINNGSFYPTQLSVIGNFICPGLRCQCFSIFYCLQ